MDKSKWVAYVIHLTKHLDANERQSKLEIPELLLVQGNSPVNKKCSEIKIRGLKNGSTGKWDLLPKLLI